MRAMDDDLQHLAARANLDDELVDYLRARKIVNVGLMASMAKDFDEVDAVIFKPLEAGIDVNGRTYKVEATDAPISKASLRYLWKLCSDTLTAPKPESPGQKPTTPVPNQSSSSKGPLKELPPEVLQKLLQHYEGQKIHGEPRVFPQRMLLGAERIVARVWTEIQNKSFTPLELQELMIHRYFDSAGNTNPLAQTVEKSSTRLLLDMTSNTMQTTEEAQWTPKGVLSLLDSLDAIQWCWVLTQIAHEMHVMNYVARWRQLVRSKASRIDQLKAFWLECSWKMCMEMRQNKPFEDVAKDIMSDTAALQTALQREAPTKPTPPKQPPRGGGHKEQRDQGTSRGYGFGDHQSYGGQKRWQQGHESWYPNQQRRFESRDTTKDSEDSWRDQVGSHADG